MALCSQSTTIILIGPYLQDLFQDVVNGLGTA